MLASTSDRVSALCRARTQSLTGYKWLGRAVIGYRTHVGSIAADAPAQSAAHAGGDRLGSGGAIDADPAGADARASASASMPRPWRTMYAALRNIVTAIRQRRRRTGEAGTPGRLPARRDTRGRGTWRVWTGCARARSHFQHGLGSKSAAEAKMTQVLKDCTTLQPVPGGPSNEQWRHGARCICGRAFTSLWPPEWIIHDGFPTLAMAEHGKRSLGVWLLRTGIGGPSRRFRHRRRQRLSLTGGLEGSERQSLEDPDRGAQADRLFALAR